MRNTVSVNDKNVAVGFTQNHGKCIQGQRRCIALALTAEDEQIRCLILDDTHDGILERPDKQCLTCLRNRMLRAMFPQSGLREEVLGLHTSRIDTLTADAIIELNDVE